MAYEDAKHRPHARHTGETPTNSIAAAPYHLRVTLDTWGPQEGAFPVLYDMLQANWGDAPSRTINVAESLENTIVDGNFELQTNMGWGQLDAEQRSYVESCFAGKTLRQALEMFTFSFLIDGCSRACTHQLVRTRIGAGMMQHGGRDNDWRHRHWIMPETINRACIAHEGLCAAGSTFSTGQDVLDTTGRKHCITDWKPIDEFLEVRDNPDADPLTLRSAIGDYLREGRQLYAALVDAGIPWEDARRLLWMGTSTYIHIYYNYIALADVLANRLEHIMDWEINAVAQLMLREIKMKCPPLFSKYLGSHSDRMGKDAFAGLQSWTPVGKYPNPHERCKECGHSPANHYQGSEGTRVASLYSCEVCERENLPMGGKFHHMEVVDPLPREHSPEQNPFWILHPDSMNGGEIKWVATNGVYPPELKPSNG